jgi:hypothetical protein
VSMNDHPHHWRATSKIFALVCDCGLTYHEWLLAEIERLKTAAGPSAAAAEITTLNDQLAEVRRERDALRADLDEARETLERQAAAITQSVTSS